MTGLLIQITKFRLKSLGLPLLLQSISPLVHDMQIWLRSQEQSEKQPFGCVETFEHCKTVNYVH